MQIKAFAASQRENHCKQATTRGVAVALGAIAGLVIAAMFMVASFAIPALAQETMRLTLQESITLTPSKENTVVITADQEFPTVDAMGVDPSRVEFAVYIVPPGQVFDPKQATSYDLLFGKATPYLGHGGDNTITLKDYLTARGIPAQGSSFVPVMRVYHFDMNTYSEVEKYQVTGNSVVYGLPAEKENEASNPDTGEPSTEPAPAPEPGIDPGANPTPAPESGADPAPAVKDIPVANLTPVLASDHPNVFIRIEDTDVHPVNGLTVTIIDPQGGLHPVTDAKLNSSDETIYKILSLPTSLFDQGLGEYAVELTQPGYNTKRVPVKFAERTTTPVVNEAHGGTVYLEDGKLIVKTDPNAVLKVEFMIDPRIEDDLIEVDASKIVQTSAGVYEVDFSNLVDQLDKHKVVKVIAAASDRAPSDIVIVGVQQKRLATEEPAATESTEAPGANEISETDEPSEEAIEAIGDETEVIILPALNPVSSDNQLAPTTNKPVQKPTRKAQPAKLPKTSDIIPLVFIALFAGVSLISLGAAVRR